MSRHLPTRWNLSRLHETTPALRLSAMTSVPALSAAGASLRLLHYFTIVEVMRKRGYLGQLELMVLLAVMRAGRDAYGVLISREVQDKSGREIALGSIYAALERLGRKGLLTSKLGEPTAERGGKARTYFKLTAAGLKEVRDSHEILMRLSEGLTALKGKRI